MTNWFYLKNIERAVFFIFLFALPLGTRYIFSGAGADFIEYRAFSLYLTDILIGLLFLFWIFRRKDFTFIKNEKENWYLLGFLAWAGVSIFWATETFHAFYWWLKLLEVVWLYFYIRGSVGKIFSAKASLCAVASGALVQVVIAVWQFTLQRDLGLQFLGESPLGASILGVAKFFSESEKYIRVYGTFPHPNIFAAYLIFAIFALVLIYYLHKKVPDGKFGAVWSLVLALFVLALFLTFARTPITILTISVAIILLMLPLYEEIDHLRPRIMFSIPVLFAFIATLTILLFPFVAPRFNIKWSDPSVTDRIRYNELAVQFVGERPLTGYGVGQYIPHIQEIRPGFEPYKYQPAHNIYLLMAAEMGLLGAFLFLAWLFSLFRRHFRRLFQFPHLVFLALLMAFAGLGAFDHYFLTIQQGMLVFWTALALLQEIG